MRAILVVFGWLLVVAPSCLAQGNAPDGVSALLGRLEQAIRSGDPNGYIALLSQNADRARAAEFAAQAIGPRVTRAVVRERDRAELQGTLQGDGYQLLVEVLIEYGQRARLATWRLDVRRRGSAAAGAPDQWGIQDQQAVTALGGLYRLSLNPYKEYTARDLVITSEDLQLTVEQASVLVAEVDGVMTGLVVLGRGDISFTPTPAIERGQVKLFAGSETLASPFDAALIRVPPSEVDAHIDRKALVERPVDPRDLKRAEELFRQDGGKSFGLDLGDLSTENWSLLPNAGDFLAEVHTRRFDTLTYARSNAEVEDISLFDRRNRKNISLYASKSHLRRYGRFFDEDEQSEFVLRQIDVDVSFNPGRRFIEGRARLAIVTRAKTGTSTLSVRLADSLTVRSVVSAEFGRLMFVRVRNQNAIVVNLPSTLTSGVPLTLSIEYGGPLAPQPIDREGIWPQSAQFIEEASDMPTEESYLYSNRSYWYPDAPTSSYATATIHVTVPQPYSVAASGDLVSVTPVDGGRGNAAARRFTFAATQPLRYLAFLVTSLVDVRSDRVRLGTTPDAVKASRLSGVFYDDVELVTKSNPRLKGRGRDFAKTGQDILRFYSSLVGDCPYPSLTLALVERSLPAGHSPAYLAVVAQPTPGSRLTFRDDPASFPEFPEFFMAHELAHQWWGQAVGWKNYHEQWLSEGFAQYFAALYAERVRGRSVFISMMRRMRRWAREQSDQGPIYLGYRIGHVKGDSRLFRAVVYNKGAVVLDMLRQLLGDRAFFNGIRRFYEEWRFDKAGSDDLRKALEAESGLSLTRFFEQWVYGQDLPQVAMSWRVEQDGNGQVALVRLEQSGAAFDVPVTLTLDYVDRPSVDLVVKLDGPLQELRLPLSKGTLRRVDINRDETLAIVR